MKDAYESLVKFYEFQLGKLPYREEMREALRATFSEKELRVFFLLPFMGMINKPTYEKRAAKAGISAEDLQAAVRRLSPEGIIDTYEDPAKGRLYGRSPVIALLEFQVRLKQDSPMRAVCTKVMNAFIEGAIDTLPNRTPYYRVLPVEATLTGKTIQDGKEVVLDAVVPDPRQVLPIDQVSEMIKDIDVIAVSDCYCRATKRLVGEDCGHPLETCFYFNELGLLKLETGYARRVDYDEAMRILRQCEEAGLVHNVSNCEGKIQTLCNCCPCSCAVLKGVVRGYTNVGAPSRYSSVLIEEKCNLCGDCVPACPVKVFSIQDEKLMMNSERCIGCGQCVRVCPEEALTMQLRPKPPKVYRDNDSLFRKINTEAAIGLLARKIKGN